MYKTKDTGLFFSFLLYENQNFVKDKHLEIGANCCKYANLPV